MRLLVLAVSLLLTAASWAQAPTVRSSILGERLSDTTSFGTTLPATIESGDVIIAWICYDRGGSDPGFSFGTGQGTFTLLDSGQTSNEVGYELRALVADGTEDSGTITHTFTTGQSFSWAYYVVQDWAGTIADDIDIGSVASGTSTTPDPPSATAGWGNDDNFVMSLFCMDSTSGLNDVSSWSLPDNQLNGDGGAGDVAIGVSTDELTTSPHNPGSYTVTNSNFWYAQTVVIEPDASGPSFTSGPTLAAATDGYTVSGTLTGSGTLTAYAVGVNPGDGTPTCAQIKSGNNDGGTSADLSANEVWTTGVANDFC